MTFTFRPAVRANVQLIIALAGGTGSGKTFTAMRLATGMSAGKRFAVIDTENGRASHYAERFAFDVCELHAPFSPDRYAEVIKAADAAGYPVILVDSMSHEYAGDGGVLDIQEGEFQRMGSRDATKMASWIKPKKMHKDMMQVLLQVRAHLILCFRAEPKVDMVKGDDGKTKIVPKQSLVGLDGWIPITEKNVPFEATTSFLLTADAPGVPKPIKLQEQHRDLFPTGKPITEESGANVAAWAAGGAAPPAEKYEAFAQAVLASADRAALAEATKRITAAAPGLTQDELDKLRALVTQRRQELHQPVGLTFDAVKAMLESAKDTDALQLAIDQIGAAPENRRAELAQIADHILLGKA